MRQLCDGHVKIYLRCQFCCTHLDSKGSLNQLIYGCLSQPKGQRDRFASLLKVWWGNKCTTVIASPHDKQTCQFKHFQGFTHCRSADIELASQLKLVWQFLAGYKGAIINLSSYARLNQFKVAFRCFYGLKDWFVYFLFSHVFVYFACANAHAKYTKTCTKGRATAAPQHVRGYCLYGLRRLEISCPNP